MGSWEDVIAALTAVQDFLEDAVTALHPDSTADEIVGELHAARLLGHVTDARLLALYIFQVGKGDKT